MIFYPVLLSLNTKCTEPYVPVRVHTRPILRCSASVRSVVIRQVFMQPPAGPPSLRRRPGSAAAPSALAQWAGGTPADDTSVLLSGTSRARVREIVECCECGDHAVF
ncbi:hypothetical protein EVAR_49052_1 [Eumeta japonica]|uniref:Uncharacterized protein n=1 Tax=Eumeta variegata TaxID=151549 RepID=A0A4C1Y5D2_EUMVA|nr:hypothetical protein EVAR_49052_1 [Eumeta japonica]